MKQFASSSILPLLAIVLTASVASAQPPRRVSDVDLAARLIGKWQVEYEDKETKRKSIGWTIYAKNGLAASRSITTVGDEEINLVLQATWVIKDAVLITTITRSSDPKIVKVASVTKDRMVALTDKQFRYVDAEGKMVTEIRVPDDQP